MTQEGRRWWPEPFFLFATAIIVDLATGKILFTRSKDREQWIPGAGGEVIIPKNTSLPLFLQDTAIRESAEELYVPGENNEQLGLDIVIKGPGPFYLECLCGESSHYRDAHGLYAYFLAVLNHPEDRDQIRGKKQPGEEDCETVGQEWLTAEEFLLQVQANTKKTYPNILRVLKELNFILGCSQTSPFLYPWSKPRI